MSTRALAAAGLFVVALGCEGQKAEPPTPPAPTPDPPAAVTAPAPPAPPAGPIAWLHDDYPAALARARQASLPLFIDLWAAWCHTCISMQEIVLRDPALTPYAGRFVWLALDTEKAHNAPVLKRLPPAAWPTFYVVSPGDESIQARHVGAASVAQVRELLEAGEQGHLEVIARGGRLPRGGALDLVRQGDRAAAAGDLTAAAEAYREALSVASADWPRAPDVLVRLAQALQRSGRTGDCARLGDSIDRATLGNTASAADAASIIGACAVALPAVAAAALRRKLIRAVEKVVDDGAAPLSADDRADALAILRQLAEAVGEPASARAYAIRQRDVLDQAAAAAKDPWLASTYNFQRVDVYTYLGTPERLLPELQKSVADLPTQYDPVYRLATLYLAMERWDDGIAAARRALEMVAGPRRAVVLGVLARLMHGKGDHEEERRLRVEAVDHLGRLPAGQRLATAEAAARDALEKYDDEHSADRVEAGGPSDRRRAVNR